MVPSYRLLIRLGPGNTSQLTSPHHTSPPHEHQQRWQETCTDSSNEGSPFRSTAPASDSYSTYCTAPPQLTILSLMICAPRTSSPSPASTACHSSYDDRVLAWIFFPTNLDSFIATKQSYHDLRSASYPIPVHSPRRPKQSTTRSRSVPATSSPCLLLISHETVGRQPSRCDHVERENPLWRETACFTTLRDPR